MSDLVVSDRIPAPRVDLGPCDPLGLFALAILRRAVSTEHPLLVVAADSVRAESLAALLQGLAPVIPTAFFPAWDCLPYDRVEPSRGILGRRSGVLRWLTDPSNRPHIVVTTPAGLIQKVPPFRIWATARLTIRPGDAVEPDEIARELMRLGYVADDRVDEPGEFAVRGRVVDIYPAAAPRPCRIEIEAGRVMMSIRSYAASTQRSVTDADELVVDPASELIPDDFTPQDPTGSDRLGAGFQVSAHDLDQRGAGDLLGEAQAGHLRNVGTALYRHLAERALLRARGATPPEEWSPELAIGLVGRVPSDYVPDEAVRLDLYVRLGRLAGETAIEDFEEELDDRFGLIPVPLRRLLVLARIRSLCLRLQVARIDAGPLAVALMPRSDATGLPGTPGQDGRMLVQIAEPDAEARAQRILDRLDAVARP